MLEEVRLAPRTSRSGAIVAARRRTGCRGTVRVAAARTTIAVPLGRGYAGRAKEDCRYANQVKYFHGQTPRTRIEHDLAFNCRPSD